MHAHIPAVDRTLGLHLTAIDVRADRLEVGLVAIAVEGFARGVTLLSEPDRRSRSEVLVVGQLVGIPDQIVAQHAREPFV